jgi:ribosome-binding ATPase YchF (GTP1/OBG family)
VNLTLFGYPKTGKTTLFNLLTGAHVEVHAYEDGKREPNVRTCPLPDPRLDRIAALFPEKRRVPFALDITDLVGISFGEVKSSLLLGHLRKADGLVHVVRGFRSADIPHARPAINPADDIRFMEEELVLADMALVAARLRSSKRTSRRPRILKAKRSASC